MSTQKKRLNWFVILLIWIACIWGAKKFILDAHKEKPSTVYIPHSTKKPDTSFWVSRDDSTMDLTFKWDDSTECTPECEDETDNQLNK